MNARRARVALETTLLIHGVPRGEGSALASRLRQTIEAESASACIVGVVNGLAKAALTDADLRTLLESPSVNKLNTANLGVAIARKEHGATTVATTMEIAARAGIRVFATGGLGGVHPQPRETPNQLHLDISADLAALTRFPLVVVASGVKSILDVPNTRELLETLGIPVIGFRTDDFSCFYLRKHPTAHVNPCDTRFDAPAELAHYARHELMRTGRAILVCNPIPPEHEINAPNWAKWLSAAEARVASTGVHTGRDATPAILAALHEVSNGVTLRANIELAVSNARLAAQIAAVF